MRRVSGTPALPSLSLTHFALFLQSLGGLQSILRHHLAHDATRAIDPRFLIFFDPPGGTADARIHPLGLTGWSSIAETRRRVGARLGERPTDVAIYHDFWALPFVADLDRASRRLGMVLCPIPFVLRILRHNLDLLDGVLCLGEPTVEAIRHALPAYPPERLHWVGVPIPTPDPVEPRPPLGGRPFVLGYSGRLEKAVKRVDRLPRLLRRLQEAGLDVRLELLGEGPAREWLTRELGSGARVVFHGRQSGGAYWRVLGGWDAIVYVSDAEGFGIALLEGMSVGALPLYPAIDGGADAYVRAVRPDLVYRPDDFDHVARVVRGLREATDAEVDALRERCRTLVAPHLGDAYETRFSEFVRRVTALPRISRETFGGRPFYLSDHWPLGILQRVYPRAFWQNRPAVAAARPSRADPR